MRVVEHEFFFILDVILYYSQSVILAVLKLFTFLPFLPLDLCLELQRPYIQGCKKFHPYSGGVCCRIRKKEHIERKN